MLKQKVKSYSFWVGILSGIGLIVKEILDAAGIAIDQTLIDQIISVVLAVACVSGVVAPAKKEQAETTETAEQIDPLGVSTDEESAKTQTDNAPEQVDKAD